MSNYEIKTIVVPLPLGEKLGLQKLGYKSVNPPVSKLLHKQIFIHF